MSDGLYSPLGFFIVLATAFAGGGIIPSPSAGVSAIAALEIIIGRAGGEGVTKVIGVAEVPPKEAIGIPIERATLEKPIQKVVPKAILPRFAPPKTKMKLADVAGERELPFGTRIAGRKASRKINLNRLLATDAERLAFAWFCENNIPFNFETTLLSGRAELNFAEVPFLLTEELSHSNYQAMRFYEQASGKTIMDGEFLTQCGYQVIDLSTIAMLNDVDTVLALALEFD